LCRKLIFPPSGHMVCNSCGHMNDEHRWERSLRLCPTPEHQCKILKSDNITFSQEADNNPSKSDDALTDMYYSFKGVRRYSIECAFPVE
jgi:hypothetical protein